MRKIIRRLFELNLPKNRSCFLWGPRKVGKSYWLNHHLTGHILIDLLKTDVFAEYAARPALLRERYQNHTGFIPSRLGGRDPGSSQDHGRPASLIVIDEIQKLPALLDEIHWLIENSGRSFLMTGSSARKLHREHANLLGGRAWRKLMVPLSYREVEGFDLEKIMISGLLPPHFLSPEPVEDLRGYIADYLKEEVSAEAQIQNIPAFSEFLRIAALTSSELLNYTNIAREAGISQKVVRNYFDILESTYLGFRVSPWKHSKTRRMILTEKFYLFDVGVANYLAGRSPRTGSSGFGKAFEHYILMELKAYQAYKNPEMGITYWRTSAGQEVDFILGDKQVALEIKASARVHEGDLRNFPTLEEDGPVKNKIIVCLEKEPRITAGKVRVLPWEIFLDRLWSGYFRL